MEALKHLNKYFWKYRYRFVLGLLFVFVSNVFGLYPPIYIGEVLNLISDSLSQNKNLDATSQTILEKQLAYYAFLVLLFAVFRGLFMFFMRQTLIVMSRMIEYDLKNEIYDHYQKLSLSFYKRNKTGDLMNRISDDVSKVRMYLGPAILYSTSLFISISLIIPKMISVSPKLTLYALSPLPILVLAIYKVSSIMNVKSEIVQKQLSKLSSVSQETFSGIRVIKSYAQEKYRANQFVDAADDYKRKSLDLVKVNALFFPLMILLIGLSTLFTIYIGGLEAIAGNIEVGDIATFVIYVNMLTWPVASLGWVTSIVQRAAASQQRINEFLKEHPEIVNSTVNSKIISGNLSFTNVSFVYPDTGIKALDNLTFELEEGQTLGIIGKIGSGKSTLAELLCRLIDPTSGYIKFGNDRLGALNLNQLRSHIGYVPQESFLFSDTIFNNIAFGHKNATDLQVLDAAKSALIYDNIMTFKENFNTVVGERGVTLSGGQKQRVSIARAFIRNPKFLLFDDCLSAVDTETEELILQNIKKQSVNKTTIIISHRASSLKHADQIIVLDKGAIIEQGSHTELLNLDGEYASVYKKQLTES
ncbi:MAG: ABC transporter ATP-binding protein [Flavobacteriales bacterium]|jgi:ATP-binding cassette subfamily B protein|tara:strand:- start:4586 stop:6346 length:1761 start_codon:yes stop_codon:yes gene_type:complete